MDDVLDCVITYCEQVDESASLEQKLRVIKEIRCLCQNFKDLTKDAKKNFSVRGCTSSLFTDQREEVIHSFVL